MGIEAQVISYIIVQHKHGSQVVHGWVVGAMGGGRGCRKYALPIPLVANGSTAGVEIQESQYLTHRFCSI